jgi:plastocyanin
VRSRVIPAVVAGAALLVSAAPAHAAKTPKKTIRLFDDYFTPDSTKVRKGTIVTWRWPGFEEAGGVHDVKLKTAPKHVKKFQSEAAASDYSFKRRLKVPGLYKFVCTYHIDMRMTIRVKH